MSKADDSAPAKPDDSVPAASVQHRADTIDLDQDGMRHLAADDVATNDPLAVGYSPVTDEQQAQIDAAREREQAAVTAAAEAHAQRTARTGVAQNPVEQPETGSVPGVHLKDESATGQQRKVEQPSYGMAAGDSPRPPSLEDPDEDPMGYRNPDGPPELTEEEIEAGKQTILDARPANPDGWLVVDTQEWDYAVGNIDDGQTPINQRGDQAGQTSMSAGTRQTYQNLLHGAVHSDTPVKGRGQANLHSDAPLDEKFAARQAELAKGKQSAKGKGKTESVVPSTTGSKGTVKADDSVAASAMGHGQADTPAKHAKDGK